MDAPNNPVFWRPRADLIRECVAAKLSSQEIKARCLAEGYGVDDNSFRQAVYSARVHHKARPIRERPSFYFLWKEFLIAYDSAYRAGKALVITQKMKDLIDVAEDCVTHEQLQPTPKRKRSRKRKSK